MWESGVLTSTVRAQALLTTFEAMVLQTTYIILRELSRGESVVLQELVN